MRPHAVGLALATSKETGRATAGGSGGCVE